MKIEIVISLCPNKLKLNLFFGGEVGLNPCIFVYWRENRNLLDPINL